MKIYQLKTSQKLPISLEKAWDLFSNPKNLAKITPDWLNFQIVTDLPPKMHEGMIIVYSVRPIFNIPTTWVTEITYVKEPFYFVDEQRFGPYKMWHHEHSFSDNGDGTITMNDLVSYVIPFGIFGRIANYFFIRHRIDAIFNYRRNVLIKMFDN